MAFTTQFRYSPPTSSALPNPQIVLSKSAHAQQSPGCLETGRGLVPEGLPGCPVGSPVSYLSRIAGLPESLYAQGGVTPGAAGVEPSAFYALGGAAQGFAMDRSQELWKTLHQQSPVLYPFDPMLAAHPYGAFYGGLDLNNAARRKNATRETTSALKAWLYEHRKNPYPTKGEKIMLAIITKMTLTQVSTWFANARRRLKKESKLGWNKDKDLDGNDSDIDIDDCEKDGDDFDEEVKRRLGSTSSSVEALNDVSNGEDEDVKVTSDLSDISDAEEDKEYDKNRPMTSTPVLHENHKLSDIKKSMDKSPESLSTSTLSLPVTISRDVTSHTVHHQYSQVVNPSPSPAHSKPKIWSIAEIVNSEKHQDSKCNSLSVSVNHSNAHFTNMHHSKAIFSSFSPRNPDTSKIAEKRCEEMALNLAMADKPKIEKDTTGNEQTTQTSVTSCSS